jgi:hypothetical protein
MAIFFALLLVLVLMACWLLTLLGLPGNWLSVGATMVYAWLVPGQSSAALGWKSVVAIFVLAALGEIIELAAGAMGVAKAGGTRRGALMVLAGSLVGGVLGVFVGLPIPMVGSVIAAVLFAGLGAMAGAILGETWARQEPDAIWRIARLAFWGRLAGTLGKIILGAVMVAVVVTTLVWQWL